MNLILINIIILTLLPIIVTSQYAASAIDIDDFDHYSDRDYYQMANEYEDNLRASFAARQAKEEREAEMKRRIAEQSENAAAGGEDDGQANVKKTSKKDGDGVESYAEMASRLKCDNPWFWNAPRCTWIDVKSNHVIARTRKNAEASAWFIGICVGFPMTWLCACYCFYLIKMKNRKKMAILREKNVPGRFELPNGKVVEYQATDEENKAYEELVKAIIIQEMSMII